jgi:hypothetical protein
MGVSGQHHAPVALYPRGKGLRYPLDRRLSGPQRIEKKSSAFVGDRTPIVQPVVKHYTDWATPAAVRVPVVVIFMFIVKQRGLFIRICNTFHCEFFEFKYMHVSTRRIFESVALCCIVTSLDRHLGPKKPSLQRMSCLKLKL